MTFQRIPEPHAIMEDDASVAGFSEAGHPGGPLFPIYHFNATRLSRLVPSGGTVLDMGCGSGRFLRYFLSGRPDVRAIAVDLSSTMLELAQKTLDDERHRVNFVRAPFAEVHQQVQEHVDAVVCLSALHHSPTYESLVDSLTSVARLQDRCQNAVWLFDLVRPEDEATAEMIPRAFELRARTTLKDAFRQDWIDSLKAGWTVLEFQNALADAALSLHSHSANYSQLHWNGKLVAGHESHWNAPAPDAIDGERARNLAAALELPQELNLETPST